MFKFSLRRVQKMSASFHVEDAAEKASWLVCRESRGPGDLPNAMRRISSRYGVPYRVLWALRYRRPADMLVSVYCRLCEAYEAECERQRKLLDHELSISQARTRLGKALVGAGASLAREKDGMT